MKLLIVDDDIFIRKGLQQLIHFPDYGITTIDEASCGQTALQKWENTDYDLVLTDIRMPNMDGLQLIEALRKRNENPSIIVLSSYDDYDYLRQAMKFNIIDYLLKPVDEQELIEVIKVAVTETITKQMNHKLEEDSYKYMKDNIFSRWIEGRINDLQLREKLHFLHIPIYSHYQLTIITADTDEQSSDGTTLDELKQAIEADLPADTFIFIHNFEKLILIHGTNELTDFENKNEKLLHFILTNLKKVYDLHFFATLGEQVANIDDLPYSFQTALDLFEYRGISDEHSLITKQMSKQLIKDEQLPKEIKETMIDSFLNKETFEWHDELELYMKQAMTKLNRLSAVQEFAVEWLIMLRLCLVKLDSSLNHHIFEQKTLKTIFAIERVDDLKQYMHECTTEVEQFINDYKNKAPLSISEQVIKLINEHFHKDLSLQSISDQLFLNSTYLGRVFKQETGEYFNDYVNHVRIEQSKQLITSTNQKFTEIAKIVGFNDPTYFYKKFKQLEGVSPGQYRKES